jgi:hypothetical protein
MKNRIKLLVAFLWLATVGMGALAFPPESQHPSSRPLSDTLPQAIECRFYRGHEHLYVANPTRLWREIGWRTVRVTAALAATAASETPPVKNIIDEYIFAKIRERGAPVARLTTDEEFLRRVSLDLTGRIPSADQVRKFVADPNPNKREALVDSLVGSEGYVARWTNFFGDLLQLVVRSETTGTILYVDGRSAWYDFIRTAIQTNMPYNEMVKQLITAEGDTFAVGPANFIALQWQRNGPIQDTYDNLAVVVGRAFLGMSLECLSCHGGAGHTNTLNLYLTTKQRSDFWKMAAFFARLKDPTDRRGRRPVQPVVVSQQPLIVKYVVTEATSGEYQLNTTDGNKTPRQPLPGQPPFVTPVYIFTGQSPASGERYRDALARMVTSDHQFAKATVNYLWKELFGIGLVEPPDGFDPLRQDPKNPPPAPWTLQPTHPELLDALATEFERSGYNLQAILKLITTSSTYQLSSRWEGEWKEEWVPLFARKYPRRLKAEEIHDAIQQATGIFNTYTVARSYDANAKAPWTTQWAMELPDPSEPRNGQVRNFLDSFLRGDRDGQMRKSDGSISQALVLLNDSFVTNRVRATNGSTVQRLLQSGLSDDRIVEELFLRTLSRFPTTQEKAQALEYLSKHSRTQAVEDIQFALLNKIDFLYNY